MPSTVMSQSLTVSSSPADANSVLSRQKVTALTSPLWRRDSRCLTPLAADHSLIVPFGTANASHTPFGEKAKFHFQP
jgi:hypothetical protein